MKNIRIRTKIPVLVLSSVFLAIVTTGSLSYREAAVEQTKASMQAFRAIGEGRKAAIENYLTSIEQDLFGQCDKPGCHQHAAGIPCGLAGTWISATGGAAT